MEKRKVEDWLLHWNIFRPIQVQVDYNKKHLLLFSATHLYLPRNDPNKLWLGCETEQIWMLTSSPCYFHISFLLSLIRFLPCKHHIESAVARTEAVWDLPMLLCPKESLVTTHDVDVIWRDLRCWQWVGQSGAIKFVGKRAKFTSYLYQWTKHGQKWTTLYL